MSEESSKTQLILRQSNKISRSPTVPGLRQAKAYRFLLMNAKEGLLKEDYHKVYQEELKDFLGSNDWDVLRESIEQLRKIDIRWDLLPQKGSQEDELLWGSSPLLADCEIRKDKNGRIYFKYSFSPKMREELANPKFFRDFDLNIVREFQSSYSMKFYEFCLSAINPGQNFVVTEFISKENFWELLGLGPQEYKNYYNFKKRVITPAIKEVNEITDLNIELERVRKGPKKYEFRFKVRRQDVQTRLRLEIEGEEDVYARYLSASDITKLSLKEEFLHEEEHFAKDPHSKKALEAFKSWIRKKYA